jgi:hypothetical protein
MDLYIIVFNTEVSNRIVVTTVPKLIIVVSLPKFLWPEAIAAATSLLNKMPSQALDKQDPYSVLTKQFVREDDKIAHIFHSTLLALLLSYRSRLVWQPAWNPSKSCFSQVCSTDLLKHVEMCRR